MNYSKNLTLIPGPLLEFMLYVSVIYLPAIQWLQKWLSLQSGWLPPDTKVFGSNRLQVKDMLKAGLVLDIFGMV